MRSPDYPWAPTEEEWRERLAEVRAGWSDDLMATERGFALARPAKYKESPEWCEDERNNGVPRLKIPQRNVVEGKRGGKEPREGDN